MIFITKSGKEIQVPSDYTYMSIEKFATEIYQQGRADAINKFVTIFESNMVWEEAHFNDEKRIIYQMHILAEQLKEQTE